MTDTTAPPRPHPVADLAGWLVGRWRLQRTIATPDGRPLASFVGELEVRRTGPASLRSREDGTLRRDGVAYPATRMLLYDVHGRTATVRFARGGHFHDLDLRSGRCDVVHPCGPDTYRGRTEVVDVDRWVQVWEVSGPTEAYVSTTFAARIRPTTGTSEPAR